MRVVLLSPNFYPRAGGVESHLVEVVRNIRDVEFLILTNSRKDADRRLALFPSAKFADVWPADLELRRLFRRLPSSWRIGQSFGALLESLRTSNRLGWLRRLEADIVHVHYLELDYLDRASNLVGMPALTRRRYTKIASSIERRAALLFTDHTAFTAPSENIPESTKEALLDSMKNIISVDRGSHEVVRSYQSLHGGRSWFIPNSVDSDEFKPTEATNHSFTVGFAARVGKLGEALWQRVAKILGDQVEWHIALAGESIDVQRALSSHMASTARVYANLDYQSMPKFYQGVNVFLNPFPGQGVGRTTLEAMSSGVPVISVGTTEKFPVQDGRTGFLVPPEADSIAQAILRVRDDDLLARHLGKNARSAILEGFSNRVLLPKLREVYATLATES